MKKESYFDKISKIRTLKKRDPTKIKREMKKINARGGFIDSKILDLVAGLNCWGVKTDMSCQGHKNAKPFPWVSFAWKDMIRVAKILLEWNYRTNKDVFDSKDVFWVIDPMAHPRIRPVSNLPLKELQKDAVAFGKFLQNLPKDHKWEE